MAKRSKSEGKDTFGEASGLEVISPLSYQRTDGASTDSLLDNRPAGGNLVEGPEDTAGFIPKCRGIDK